jgi:hypothetical protein
MVEAARFAQCGVMHNVVNRSTSATLKCPSCGTAMSSAELVANKRESDVQLCVGHPSPPVVRVPVWRCEMCRSDYPRLNEVPRTSRW